MQSMYSTAYQVQPQQFQGFYPLLYDTRPDTPTLDVHVEAQREAHEHHRNKRYTMLMLIVLNVVLAMFFCMYNTAAFAYASEDAQMSRMLLVSESMEMEGPTPTMLLSESLIETHVPSFTMVNTLFDNTTSAIEEAMTLETEIIVIEDDETPLASSTENDATEASAITASVPQQIETVENGIEPIVEQDQIVNRYVLPANTIDVNGAWVPYIHCVRANACPDFGAGLWEGDDDVNDGSFSYFVGHNPGDFTCVYNLRKGEYVGVCDCTGQMRTYHVTDIYEVPDTISFDELRERLIPEGECLVMQTCISLTSDHYRIVVCR